MAEHFDILIRGGICALDGGSAAVDIGIRAGRIAAIGAPEELGSASAEETIDASGLHVLPGAIDPQVHFREPGFEYKEDIESGTRAAAKGGFTSVFEMPNTQPPTTSAEALADKFARARGRAFCDHAFFVGATPENADSLGDLERLPGCPGVKVFMGKSTGNLLVHEDSDLRRVLASGSKRVAVHAEDEDRLRERAESLDLAAGGVAMHPIWRDVQTALRATERLLALARETNRRVHVLHVTTAEEIALLAENRDIATFECTPQHLLLSSPSCYADLGTRAQMNPPIRTAEHGEALWSALANRSLDALASDHAPHTLEEKALPYPESPSGMTGVQTTLILMLDQVSRGRLSLERLVELCCSGPARVWGAQRKGRLALDFDADLVLVDTAAERRIENDWIESRCGWTPFDGREVTGWPVATLVRGHTVMRDDELIGPPIGEPVEFVE
ncbi:MAG: dihydroorotase [Myxococcota bacterium]|nr:dihydroorotase [Myxococcota bacterium]